MGNICFLCTQEWKVCETWSGKLSQMTNFLVDLLQFGGFCQTNVKYIRKWCAYDDKRNTCIECCSTSKVVSFIHRATTVQIALNPSITGKLKFLIPPFIPRPSFPAAMGWYSFTQKGVPTTEVFFFQSDRFKFGQSRIIATRIYLQVFF